MKSRVLSFIIIISMLFGILPNAGMVTAYGVTGADVSIDVRVEGPDGNLYEETVSVTSESNGLELLQSAIGEDRVLGSASEYGYFLTGIKDEAGNAIEGIYGDEYSTGWGLYEIRGGRTDSSSTGLDGISLTGLEELLLHYKAYDSNTYADATYIPRVSAEQNGLSIELVVNKEITSWDESFNPVVSEEPMAGAVVKIGETEYVADDEGIVAIVLEFGSYVVSVYKEGDNYPELVKSYINLILDDGEESEAGSEIPDDSEASAFGGMTNLEVIEQIVGELRSGYGNDSAYSFREALGYLHSGSIDDQSAIAGKILLRTTINQATDLAANIIAKYAAGEETSEYTQALIDSQNENGIFELDGEGIYATQLAWSMIALDMTGGEYNKETAIAAMLSFQGEDGGFGSTDVTAMCLAAMGNHESSEGVADAINNALLYLNNRITSIVQGANQYTVSAVINGLAAIGENVLADSWMDGDESLLTRLVGFYEEGSFGNSSADEQAFLALVDLIEKQSVFTGQSFLNNNYNELFIAAEEQTGSEEPEEDNQSVDITIKGYDNNTILSKTSMTIGNGDSILDVTEMVLDIQNISYDASGGYMSEIDGLAAFDYGGQSGWMFSINGDFPDYSADSVEAEDGDDIKWVYTVDLGNDVGDNSSASGLNEKTDAKNVAEEVLKNQDATIDELNYAFDALMEEEGKDSKEMLLLLAKAAIKKAGETSLDIRNGEPAEMRASALENLAKASVKQAVAMKEAFEDEGIILDKALKSRVEVTVEEDGDTASVAFAWGALRRAFDEDLNEVALITPWAELALGVDTLREEDMDKEVVVEVKSVDAKDLPEDADMPKGARVIDMNLFVDGVKKTDFNGRMTVSIPFNPETDNADALTVYWLNDDGSVLPVGGVYKAETGMIVFETNHFSKFFVDESSVLFEDMALAAWAKDEVSAMAGKGFINGRSQGVFDPSNDITRAEFAAIAARMLNLSESDGYETGFEDVADTDWYSVAVASVKSAGIMNGKGKGLFDPNGKITRQEQGVVLSNILKNYGYSQGEINLEDEFNDAASIASWAEDGAVCAVHHGLIKGIEGRFAPDEEATRAQSAVMLYRLYVKIMK